MIEWFWIILKNACAYPNSSVPEWNGVLNKFFLENKNFSLHATDQNIRLYYRTVSAWNNLPKTFEFQSNTELNDGLNFSLDPHISRNTCPTQTIGILLIAVLLQFNLN